MDTFRIFFIIWQLKFNSPGSSGWKSAKIRRRRSSVWSTTAIAGDGRAERAHWLHHRQGRHQDCRNPVSFSRMQAGSLSVVKHHRRASGSRVENNEPVDCACDALDYLAPDPTVHPSVSNLLQSKASSTEKAASHERGKTRRLVKCLLF